MADSGTGFVALYRWRVRPGTESDFTTAWARLTEVIRDHQRGRGSRLHRGDDGLFYGYAQWPDRDTWAEPWDLPPEADAWLTVIRSSVIERFEPILLEPIGDLLLAD